jgi:adenylyl-sulfate kinase
MNYRSERYRPFTIWLTGLPSSGKSTIASLLQERFNDKHISSVILDGDELRKGLNKDLDLSVAGRKENIRRSVEVCKLMMNAGVVVIAALISPFEADREWAKQYLGKENFFLIYLNCPLEICQARDVKGLYRKAREGIIQNLTGVSSPYEIPLRPDLTLETHLDPPTTCVETTLSLIENLTIIKSRKYHIHKSPVEKNGFKSK